jgi:Holliday junction resolvase RusA-like endonuclease
MMKQIEFEVFGQPQGKARAKTVRLPNGFSHSYTPEKTVNYESAIIAAFLAVVGNGYIPVDHELAITIDAYYQIPASCTKKRRALMANNLLRPKIKPDSDNIAKIVCDSLSKIAYVDDTRIVDLSVHKWHTNSIPMIRVVIKDARHIEAFG